MESLSNNDGESYKRVILKVNSRCFKLYRAYTLSFSLSNAGKFFWN